MVEATSGFDITILYHPGKANVVADALSRRAESLGSLVYLSAAERPVVLDVHALANQERQYNDPHLLVLKDMVHHGDANEVTIGDDGTLRMKGRLCVPNVNGLRELILQEAHSSRLKPDLRLFILPDFNRNLAGFIISGNPTAVVLWTVAPVHVTVE
ncbi:uncharacterized protein [Nicotiana tomentosiformis]|uniref:uncharacterized protein n=1 Tax=Nicotiana tomentosiformis TaxID=4098 RepID=UPI00388C8226